MNRNQLEGNWKQIKGHARRKWGELTDDDLEEIRGDRQILVGKLQERYGKGQVEVEREVQAWFDELETAAGG
jgi:uncharacterized protein YjbJ (UPF0337 family)